MARNVHNFAVPGAARVYPAGAAADYTLIADRNAHAKPAPAVYALFVDVTIPKGPAPPEYALAGDVRPNAAEARRRRFAYWAFATALAFHLAVLANLLPRQVPSIQRGLEDGVPETLNVGIISSADLERLSSDPFRQEGNRSPSKDETLLQERELFPAPQQPERQEASASDPRKRPFDASAYLDAASQQFSAQLDYSFKAAQAHREVSRQAVPQRSTLRAGNIESMRPGATHVGKSDQFERDVLWALNGHKPLGNGNWGISTVTFIVSAAGRVEGLRLTKSSGDRWLDDSVMMAVQHTPMPAPPPELPAGDRTFIINYISEQWR